MPLYEYQCTRCQRRIEKIQTFSAEPLTTCEVCGGPLEKLISAPAIQFKGSGWYVTDYAKTSGAVPGPSSHADSGGEKKADAPAAPAPTPAAPAAATPKTDSK